jgi:hypothetical protein
LTADPPAIREEMQDLKHRLMRTERLLTIGFADQIQAKRDQYEVGDEIAGSVLERTLDWTPAGDLKRDVEAASGGSSMTVKRRLNRLVELGALERRGKAASTEYRNTGLLG